METANETRRNWIDADLIRVHLKRLKPNSQSEWPAERTVVMGVGDFVSMPYLVGANIDAHARYQTDRLFSVIAIDPDHQCATIQAISSTTQLHQHLPITIQHEDDDVAIELTGITTRAQLRKEAGTD
jgi:hypothetical protein